MKPTLETLRQEVLQTLDQAKVALSEATTEARFNEVLGLLGGLPGLVRAQLLGKDDLQQVQSRMQEVQNSMRTVAARRPSYSVLPAAAQSFRKAGEDVSNNPIMKGK